MSSELSPEPGSRGTPLTLDCCGGNVHDLSSFFHVEATKEPELDKLSLAGGKQGETLKRLVEICSVKLRGPGNQWREVEGCRLLTGSALESRSSAGVVRQHAPHDLRGNPKKMSPVLPAHSALTEEPNVGFVDELSGLELLTRRLASQIATGETVNLCVNERNELVEGTGVTISPRLEKLGDVTFGRHCPPSSAGADWR